MIKGDSLGRTKWRLNSLSGKEVHLIQRDHDFVITYGDASVQCPFELFVIGGWEDLHYSFGDDCRSTLSLSMRSPIIDRSLFWIDLDLSELESIKDDEILRGYLQVSVLDAD